MKDPHLFSFISMRLSVGLLSILTVVICCGCSPGYVFRAAYEHSGILWRRVTIEDQLRSPETPPNIKSKLALIMRAREHAHKLGFTTNNIFTKYSPYERDALAWIVVGAKKDSFELKTWWFPIVGTVPYKGFFEREDALTLANQLQVEDYETSVRPTVAFSTLGWFNDPVITPLLKLNEISITENIFHELFHSTLWVPGAVSFNESLANFVGLKATLSFCAQQAETCLQEAQENERREFALAKAVNKLTKRLRDIYNSKMPKDEKLLKKQQTFDEELTELKQTFPNLGVLKQANNAEIMQLQIYLENFDAMQSGFERCGSDIQRFVKGVKHLVYEGEDVEVRIFESQQLCG